MSSIALWINHCDILWYDECMSGGLKLKSIISTIALLVLALALVLVVLFTTHPRSGTPSGSSSNTAPTLTGIASLPPSDVPSILPGDLPLEKNVQILQNFTATDSATGKLQATRVYVSKLTADNNFAIFQNYLMENGWSIGGRSDQPNMKYLYATKDSARMDVTIAKNSSGEVTVDISYLK